MQINLVEMAAYKDIDKGFNALEKRLKEFKTAVIKVGVQGREAQILNDGVTVATYATTNEFGTKTAGKNGNIVIPERSFIRSTTDKKKYWKVEIDKAYNSIIDGKDTAIAAIAKVGIIARDDIKQTITDGIPPPNAESTIKKKKSSHPLIDTGILRNSITYKFADRDGY
jgi:phage gpG-like protein